MVYSKNKTNNLNADIAEKNLSNIAQAVPNVANRIFGNKTIAVPLNYSSNFWSHSKYHLTLNWKKVSCFVCSW